MSWLLEYSIDYAKVKFEGWSFAEICTMQCKGRYCKEAREIKFPLISGYFTEIRCKQFATENPIDKELCDKCAEQKKAGFRCKNQQSYYQGKIDEPYFENSWMYGSPRFLKYVAIPGNSPPADALKAAEEAQRTAREGGQMKEGEAPKKKPGRPAGSKTVNKVIQPSVKKTGVGVKSVAVESPEEPIEVLDVVKVSLKPFAFKETNYWYDENTHLLYEAPNGSIGGLVGRWIPDEGKLMRIFRSLEK